jgi:gluconolactonase
LSDTVIAAGFQFPEGICVGPDGTLHLVELAGGCVSRIRDGQREVLASPGGAPNGAAFDGQGRLVFCNNGGNWPAAPSTGGEHGLGGLPALIQRLEPDGSVSTVVDEIDGRALNSPNDICFDPDGGFWFTDPRWAPRRDDLSLDMSRVGTGDLCHVAANGTRRRTETGLRFPNGLALSDDGRRLWVDETATGKVHVFDVAGPGELGPSQLCAELGEDAVPDGMCLDVEGRLYVASHGTGKVFVLEDGELVEEILFEDAEITNVCFGGPERRTLYVTMCVTGAVASVERTTPGMVLFPDR